jgi:hypothetical protein
VPSKGLELEPLSGRERSGSPLAKSRARRGTSTQKEPYLSLVPSKGLELEPFSGRERSGSPLAKSRARRGTSTQEKPYLWVVPSKGLELEPLSGRERSGSPLAKSRARRGTSTQEKPYLWVVPSKGLEPPHRCRYMDLNHARLPIPPRWQSFDLQSSGGLEAAESGKPFLFYSRI